MNALAPAVDFLPNQIAPPALPTAVQRAVNDWLDGVRPPDNAPPLPLDQCAAWVARYDADSGPAIEEDVRKWLLALCGQMRNPPSPHEMRLLLAGTMAACADLPSWTFNPQTLAEAIRRFPWRPSGGDIYAVLADETRDVRRVAAALRALSQPPPAGQAAHPPSEPRGEPTEAEREHVKRAAATIRAELEATAAASPSGTPGRVRACFASDGALLAGYEAQMRDGGPQAGAAQIRADMLRAKIAREAAQRAKPTQNANWRG